MARYPQVIAESKPSVKDGVKHSNGTKALKKDAAVHGSNGNVPVFSKTEVKQLPVTLLSGFLGSGKTTLLEHILKSHDHGLRIAVIVNDMSTLNIDAALITKHVVTQSQENLIQMQNGCICCTLRGDLLEELARLSQGSEVDYVVIESSGISEPQQVAETFTKEFSEFMGEEEALAVQPEEAQKVLKEVLALGGLHKLARLDTAVTVVDAANLLDNFSTAHNLSDRWKADTTLNPEDERTVTDLLVDQIEFADVIVLNKLDMVDEQTKDKVVQIVKQLNPVAKTIEAQYSKVDVKEIINTGRFDYMKAASGSGWLQSLHEMTQRDVGGKTRLAPKPETEEYGISSFVYRARRPFDPRRLWAMIYDKFLVIQNVDLQEEDEEMDGTEGEEESEDVEMEDDSEDDGDEEFPVVDDETRIRNKKNHPAYKNLLRAKGFYWLASRPQQYGEWSQAGAILTLQGGDRWFCVQPEEDWPMDEQVVESIRADFEGPWGDRRQEIVCIGLDLQKDLLTEAFDRCLLDDGEMKQWEAIMEDPALDDEAREEKMGEVFQDHFQDWSQAGDGEDDEGHDHSRHNHRH